jgi:hypothetical protein
MEGRGKADDGRARCRAAARLVLLVFVPVAPGCAAASRVPNANAPAQVRLQDDDGESDVDRSARNSHYDDEEQLREAPPPFLFPGLRRWLQEDDPDGSEEGEDHENRMLPRSDPKIDIRHPDPDTANFPNSAFTIPQGRVYIENSPVSFYGRSAVSAPIYNWEFLFRYGLTDRLEFRLFSNGFTNRYGSLRYPRGSPNAVYNQGPTTGFSPLAWDFKFHLWDEHKARRLPAAGIEVYMETNMGSPAFSQGTQPSINLLFDHSLPYDFQFEWNIGIAGNLTAQNAIYYTVAAQWALQRRMFSDDLVLFTHGYLNNAALPRFAQSDSSANAADVIVVGAGAQYTLTDRLAVFGSFNFGVTPSSPDQLALMGFAFAM